MATNYLQEDPAPSPRSCNSPRSGTSQRGEQDGPDSDEDIDRQIERFCKMVNKKSTRKDRPSSFVGRAGSSVWRRVSLASSSISELSNLHETMEQHLDPEATQGNDYDRWSIAIFVALQLLSFGLIISFQAFPTLAWTAPTAGVSVLLMITFTKLLHTNTRGQRTIHVLGMSLLVMSSSLMMLLITSPCSHCVYHWGSKVVQDFSATQTNPSERLGMAWDLLLGPSQLDTGNDELFMSTCRKCVGSIFFSVLYWKENSFLGGTLLHEEQQDLHDKEEKLLHIQPYHNAEELDGDLAAWFLNENNKNMTSRSKALNQKFAKALSGDGHLEDAELVDVLEELLCSQASRVDNPDPAAFLSSLRKPKFSGETQGLNISAAKLQSIMRGDMLRDLGGAHCFHMRFALFGSEDPALEKRGISYTQMLPIANEEGMKASDRTLEMPFLITPGIDQDIDLDGSGMKRVEKVVDIFTKFPFNDKPYYFETQDEYYAFFRWELEGALQDDFYYPRWYLETEKRDDFVDFMATQLKHQSSYIVLEDPYSDATLGARCFYGTGQEFLTPVKLPGISEDYEFKFPNGPRSFMTDEHREVYRYANKPSPEQLLDMIYKFWPKEAKKRRPDDEVIEQLARFKNRMLEIDYASWESIEVREDFIAAGCILYLDPKTKLPMGLWESNRRHLYLPGEEDWDHAKYYYRVMERVALATRHVIESHFTWSHPLATASWQTLPENHGLRILTKPFTLHVHSINSAAYHMLIRDHSFLNHASGFTRHGYTNAFMDIQKDFNFSQSIPKAFEARKIHKVVDLSTLPYYNDGLKLWDAHREFVENFVHLLYSSDEEMLQDTAVIRFWHHVNTYGRHLDPCVCGMESDHFFNAQAWPGFEHTHTCSQLLDNIGYGQGMNDIVRRREWCDESDSWMKVKAMRSLLEFECKQSPKCTHLPYEIHSMRADMGLPKLESRSQLIDYITTVIWYSTAGHKFLADNLSYFVDPDYSGVRMREYGPVAGERPLRIDVSSYVLAVSIGAFTSLRTPPLMADWTPLYSHYAAKQTDLSAKERKQLFQVLEDMHKKYKFRLLDLAKEMLDESLSRPLNHRWNTMNPATQASSVAI